MPHHCHDLPKRLLPLLRVMAIVFCWCNTLYKCSELSYYQVLVLNLIFTSWAASRLATPVDAVQEVSILAAKMTCGPDAALKIQCRGSRAFKNTLIFQKKICILPLEWRFYRHGQSWKPKKGHSKKTSQRPRYLSDATGSPSYLIGTKKDKS